jgi:hypothetical protein
MRMVDLASAWLLPGRALLLGLPLTVVLWPCWLNGFWNPVDRIAHSSTDLFLEPLALPRTARTGDGMKPWSREHIAKGKEARGRKGQGVNSETEARDQR